VSGSRTLYPVRYRPAFACSLFLSPLLPSALLAVRLPLREEQRGYFVHPYNHAGGRSCLWTGGASSAAEEKVASAPGHIPFWFKPVSIFGLFGLTVFTALQLVLTCPGLLAPDRLVMLAVVVSARAFTTDSVESRLRCPAGFAPPRCQERTLR
jgi:hypothetical protein